jgi:hypothetical protein
LRKRWPLFFWNRRERERKRIRERCRVLGLGRGAPETGHGGDIFSSGRHSVFGCRVGRGLRGFGFMLWFNNLGGRGEVGPDPALWVGTTWRRSGGKLRGERYGKEGRSLRKQWSLFFFTDGSGSVSVNVYVDGVGAGGGARAPWRLRAWRLRAWRLRAWRLRAWRLRAWRVRGPGRIMDRAQYLSAGRNFLFYVGAGRCLLRFGLLLWFNNLWYSGAVGPDPASRVRHNMAP